MKAQHNNLLSNLSIHIFLLLTFLHVSAIHAQTVLLQEDQIVQPKTYGVNQSHYFHIYLGYGFAAGQNEPGSEIQFGKSGGFRYGFRYKQKLSNWLALGTDLGYHGTNFVIKQITSKTFPDGLVHKSEKLILPAFEASVFARFNFDPGRGNYMGNFLDLGLAYNRNIGVTQRSKDVMSNGTEVEVNVSNMNYVNYDNWLLISRLGKNKFMLTASYRLSDVFISKSYNELPRFKLGLEIGFY